jgi:putative phage-type endonuclease
MITIECDQGTPEWRAARLGKLTASRIHDAVAKTKTGWGASRANLMAALIAERLTGVPQDTYTNAAMQHGIDTEPEARAAYEFRADVDVMTVGFIVHPTIGEAGCSPDGLVGDDGLVEIKCPQTATHLDTLLHRAVPDKYVKQAMWQMACTGRQWVDYVSYDPRLPESMRLWVKRIPRDDGKIAELEGEAVAFLKEIHDKITTLRATYEPADLQPLLMAG